MANQLTLAFTVNVAGTSYGPAKASAALAAVPLYANASNDPVLGQLLGLTVDNDATAESTQTVLSASNTSPIVVGVASTAQFRNGDTVTVASVTGNTAANGTFLIAGLTPTTFQLVGSTGNGAYGGGGTVTDNSSITRTLTLNTTSANSPTAPPPFPCNPITATPPVPPYPLLTPQALPGNFLTTPGSAAVGTSFVPGPSISVGNKLQFLAQPGVFYTVATVMAVPGYGITLTTPYTGPFSQDGGAVLMIAAPAKIIAVYSTAPEDSIGTTITPSLPSGSGAWTVEFTYTDSLGAGPYTVSANLQGTYPVPIPLHAGSVDVAIITAMQITATGGFGNSVGQITLCELSSTPTPLESNMDADEFQALIDQTQGLISRGLVDLPPSYFALAQQGASTPALKGTFQLPGKLTTRAAGNAVAPGGVSIATSVNQSTGPALAPTNQIEFAAQPGVLYTVAAVGAGNILLTTAYTGLNDDPILSSARLVSPTPALPPTAAQLSGAMAEFVNPGTAVPPPRQPLAPQTMSPSPVFLSGMFARTLQLALAVPVVPSAIVLS